MLKWYNNGIPCENCYDSYGSCFSLLSNLFSQVDLDSSNWPKTTLTKILKKLELDKDLVAIRESNKIYQGGSPVGDVTGEVRIKGDEIEFTELSNTQGLNHNIPFEYQRDKYQIESFSDFSGRELPPKYYSENSIKEGTLCNVSCKKVK